MRSERSVSSSRPRAAFVKRGASVTLSVDTIAVARGGRTESMRWSDIDEVALRGSRLTLVSKSAGGDTALLNPRPPGDPTFMSLVVAVQDRLNANRGYGGRTG